MYDPQLARQRIHDLLVDTYGSVRAAAPRVGLPHKTLHRMVTSAEGDRSKEVSFDKVLQVISALHRDNPDITLASILVESPDLS